MRFWGEVKGSVMEFGGKVAEVIKKSTPKQKVALCAIPLFIIVLILLIFMPSSPLSNTPHKQEIVYEDSIDIGKIVSDVSSSLSNIKTFTNEYSDESSLILSDLGIDMTSIASYSANIDTRYESAHAIVILRPKSENYTACKKALADYVARKQRELYTLSNIEDTGSIDDTASENASTYANYYQTAVNSLIYEHGDYLILVMEDTPQSIAEQIMSKIDISLSLELFNSSYERYTTINN